MQINFFKFAKLPNSTAIPNMQPNSQGGNLLFQYTAAVINDSSSSLLKPDITVKIPNAQALTANYCQITSFDRYYYINDWTYNADGTWTASCSVDAMASWRTAIHASGGYVGRGNANVNASVADDVYPTELYMLNAIDSVNTGMSDAVGSGTIVIGVLDKGSSLVGPVSYYAMTPSAFEILCNELLSYGVDQDFSSLTSLNSGAIKSIVDPMQYIVSCKWFPLPLSNMFTTQDYTYATSIYLGGWHIDFGSTQANHPRELNKTAFAYPNVNTSPTPDLIIQDITHHITLDATTGPIDRFPNYPPYARYTLQTPWGVYELDGTIIFNMFANHQYQTRKIRCTWSVYADVVTGQGTFVFRGDLNPNSLHPVEDDYEFFRADIQIGVDIPLASMAMDYVGISNGMGSALQSGMGAIGSAAAKDVLGMVGSFAGFFGSLNNAVASSISPKVNSSAVGMAAFNNLITRIQVQQTRYRTIDQSEAIVGKPVKKYVTSLSDFAAATVPFVQMDKSLFNYWNCTHQEQQQIIDYLEGGCYLL